MSDKISSFIATLLVLVVCADRTLAEPKKMTLWTERAPIGDGQFGPALPTVTVYKPTTETATGTAMLICPGGGYSGLVTGGEGHYSRPCNNQNASLPISLTS